MNSPCVMWPGATDKDGYGFVKISGRQFRAHRVALAKRLGRNLGPRELALHLCNNPGCVNPEHLEPGTAADNNRQARARRQTLARSILGVDSSA